MDPQSVRDTMTSQTVLSGSVVINVKQFHWTFCFMEKIDNYVNRIWEWDMGMGYGYCESRLPFDIKVR